MANNDNKVAIIGFSGAFPGVDNVCDLWHLTSRGICGITFTEEEELTKNLPREIIANDDFIPYGGGPSGFKNFDANFFGYSPKEAKLLDPQIRKLLEYSWHTFEHAGYCPDNIEVPVGVYVSSSVNSYFIENLHDNYHRIASEQEKIQMLFLNESDFLSSRISYHFQLKGPSIYVEERLFWVVSVHSQRL